MSDKVYEALKRAGEEQRKAATVNIDGYKNFLFLNQSGYPKVASSYESMFKGLSRSTTSSTKRMKPSRTSRPIPCGIPFALA